MSVTEAQSKDSRMLAATDRDIAGWQDAQSGFTMILIMMPQSYAARQSVPAFDLYVVL